MHAKTWLLALVVAGLAFAGCVENESTPDESADAQNARHFTVDVPAGATQVHVDVNGRAVAGEPDVTVLVEDEGGANLATDTFSVGSSAHRRVSADVDGHARLVVTVRVVDGDAELDVRVSATVPDQPDAVVITEQRVVIVQVVQQQPSPAAPTATSPAPDAPTPAEPTPASPPPTEPTPPATNASNATATNGTNATP